MQANNGLLEACHIITAIKLTTLSPEGSSISKLHGGARGAAAAAPVEPGPNVEDFCALNSSLRGLIASLVAMARMGNSRPPLRDLKLTRILSGSVLQGEGVEMAMDVLRESDKRELSALSKQVNALQERLNSAKQERARLHSQDHQEKGLGATSRRWSLVTWSSWCLKVRCARR